MVRKLLKKSAELTVRPLILRYLKNDRKFSYEGLKLVVRSGIFHPLFFFSTTFLMEYLKKLPIKGKKLLEPGCGAGLISVWAAKNGALVTALDINPLAVANTRENAQVNNLDIKVLESDLFNNLATEAFDFIVINPPYYPQNPTNPSEYAWYCGTEFEFFEKLFQQLPEFYVNSSMVLMVLSEDCNMQAIQNIAHKHSQQLNLLEERRNFFEKNFIYRITSV